jgi:dihydrofolate reductase
MVIGGAEIYKAALEIADKVYLTYIDRDVEGDAWFPVLDGGWNLKGVFPGEKTASESYEYRVYEKEKLAG